MSKPVNARQAKEIARAKRIAAMPTKCRGLARPEQDNWFSLAGVLSDTLSSIKKEINDGTLDFGVGLSKFPQYLEDELGIPRTTAVDAIKLRENFLRIAIDGAKLAEIGWEKAALIGMMAHDDLRKNFEDIAGYAQDHTLDELIVYIHPRL